MVARRFLQRRLVPYLPLDSLMMGFTNGIPAMGSHDKLWPHEIAEKMWLFFEAVCENMLHNQFDYLFEGEAVLPERIQALASRYPGQLAVCFMGFAAVSPTTKITAVKQHPNPADWLVAQPDEAIAEHIENMIGYSQRLKQKCRQYGLAYFDTRSNFENSLEAVVAFLESHAPTSANQAA